MTVASRPATAAVTGGDTSARFVARQPIFDRQRTLVGYELLYRDRLGAETSATRATPEQMTSRTIVHGLLDIGLDRLVGSVPAWVNVSRELLVSESLDVLPKDRVVLEILETVEPDAEVVAACERLVAQGFTLALDDFVGGPGWEQLVPMARIIKLDVLGADAASLWPQMERCRRGGARLLAERIEDQEMYRQCLLLGFDYFQGYHFQKPETVQRNALPVAMARIAKLMALVGDPRVSDAQLEAELRGDQGLSVKLLRIVNNAASGYQRVSSIRHAIQLAGRRALHHWLAMLFVASVPTVSDVDREALLVSLERGRFCELLALEQGRRDDADPAFLVGLLAQLDQRLGVPMDELVRQLGVSDDVSAALRGEPGPHTTLLTLATAYSSGAWERVVDVAAPLGVEAELPELYGMAGSWARDVLAAA